MRLKDLEEWLTPVEAARIIGVSRQTVFEMLEERKLRGVKTHLGYLCDPADVERVRKERNG